MAAVHQQTHDRIQLEDVRKAESDSIQSRLSKIIAPNKHGILRYGRKNSYEGQGGGNSGRLLGV
jgi:hypothetical protein